MMTVTLGVVVKNAFIGSQSKFAVHQKRRKSVSEQCDEIVTILSLALWGQLTITALKRGCLHSVPEQTNTTIMIKFKSKLRALVLAAGSLAISATAVQAQNTNYAAGDLVLFFQQEGGSETVYANIGNTATTFRGAAAGVDVANSFNFLNINSTLVSAFGAGWATDTSIYAGLAGVWGTSGTTGGHTNGDPHRTLYVSAARSALGTIGEANSSAPTVNGNTAMTTAASGMLGQNNILETTYNTAVAQSPTSTSGIDNANPFLSAGIQGPAFGTFDGGVQQRGTGSTIGSYDSAGNAVFALDLYRVLARATGGAGTSAFVTGQVDGPLRSGSFEGTVVLNTAGDISFVTAAVPEPSTYAFMGVAAVFVGFYYLRRRKAKA